MSIVHVDDRTSAEGICGVLDCDGVVVVDRLAPEPVLLAIERELAPWLALPPGESPMGNNPFTGFRTLRTSGLVGKSRACGELVMSSLVLAILDHVLGPQCSRYQLSFTQAIGIAPGEVAQVLHQDTTMYPLRRPGPEVFVNAMWALTDFTDDNGATCFHIGSHRWDEGRTPQESDPQAVAAMPRGSVALYFGSCWHGGGANASRQPRVGVSFGYTLGWLRQEENQYLAVPPDFARTLPIELQRIIGYAEHHPFLGWHEGQRDDVFRGGSFRKTYASTVVGGASKTVRQIMTEGESARRKTNRPG